MQENYRLLKLYLVEVVTYYLYIKKLSILPIYILKLLCNSSFLPHIMYCLDILGNNVNKYASLYFNSTKNSFEF